MKSIHILETDPEKYLLADYSDRGLQTGRSVYVFPDTIAISEARDLLLRHHDAIDSSLFMTLEGLASQVVREVTGEQPLLLTDDLKALLARYVFRGMKTAGTRLPEEYSDILVRDYETLRPLQTDRKEWIRTLLEGSEAEFDKGKFDFRISVLDEFSALIEERLKVLAENGIYDRTGLIRKATELLKSADSCRIGKVNFFFLHFADPAVLSFILGFAVTAEVRLVAGMDQAESSSPALSRFRSIEGVVVRKDEDGENIKGCRQPPEIEFFGAPDRRREIIQIARTIRRRISEGGCRESDFKILARNIDDYDSAARDILNEYGLAVERGRRRLLEDDPVFAGVENFFRCLEEDATKEDFLRIIPDADYRILLSDSRLSKSLERLPSMLRSWRRETFRRNGYDIDGCWSRTSELATVLSDLKLKSSTPHSVGEWVEIVEETADRITTANGSAESSRFIPELMSAAVSWSAVCNLTGLEKLTLGDFLTLFRSLGKSDTGEGRSERSGILLTDVGITYFRRAAGTFIVGANFEIFPRGAEQNSFLPVKILDCLERSGIETRRCTRVVDSAERWYYLKARGLTDRLTVSFISNPEVAGYGIPSPFIIEEIKKRWNDGDPISIAYDSNLPAGKYIQDPGEEILAPAEIGQMLAYRFGCSRQYAEEDFFAEMWKRACKVPFSEFSRRLSRFDSKYLEWNFSAASIAPLTSDRILSPTDLNHYAKCPFRFVLTRLMKLSAAYGDFEQIGIGRDVHAILKTFLNSPDRESIGDMDARMLKRAIEAAVDAYYSRQYTDDYLSEPVAITGTDRVKSALFLFLSRERELQKLTCSTIELTEHSFGTPDGLFRIGEFEFRGIIDRVDTVPLEDHGAILLDYKFTTPARLKSYFRTDADLPLDFEIPVYSIYLRDELGYKIRAALYYSILKSTGLPDRAGIVVQESAGKVFPDLPRRKTVQLRVMPERELDAEIEKFRRNIISLASEIRSNRFPVRPAKGECGNCSFMTICRNWRGLTSDE